MPADSGSRFNSHVRPKTGLHLATVALSTCDVCLRAPSAYHTNILSQQEQVKTIPGIKKRAIGSGIRRHLPLRTSPGCRSAPRMEPPPDGTITSRRRSFILVRASRHPPHRCRSSLPGVASTCRRLYDWSHLVTLQIIGSNPTGAHHLRFAGLNRTNPGSLDPPDGLFSRRRLPPHVGRSRATTYGSRDCPPIPVARPR